MNKTYNILCVLFIMSFRLFVFGQNTLQEPHIFVHPEHFPEFQGGENALYKFIQQNLKYPNNWPKDSISGKVFLQITIDSSGNVSHPIIIRGLNPTLDSIAIKICRAMPKWHPARSRNEPVKWDYLLPIRFGESSKPIKKTNKKKKN